MACYCVPILALRCVSSRQILSANSNQWYFNSLVKKPCHKTHCRCPHRLNLSFQSSRACAFPNIKVLKDKDLEFANSIRRVFETIVVVHAREGTENQAALTDSPVETPAATRPALIWVLTLRPCIGFWTRTDVSL